MKLLRFLFPLAFIICITNLSQGLTGVTFTTEESAQEQYIMGEIISQTNESILINHPLLGEIMIPIEQIIEINSNITKTNEVETDSTEETSEEVEETDETTADLNPYGDDRVIGTVGWDNSLSLGFTLTKGTDLLMNYSGSIAINRNRLWIDEWTLNAAFDRRHDNKELTYEKYEGSLRYGRSLTIKLYGFIMMSASHNLETQLDYELLPTAGLGYWISDSESFKLMGEIGGGYQYSVYTDPRTEQDVVVEGRAYLEWLITDDITFTEDFQIIPKVTFNSFNMYNDAKLALSLIEDLSLNFLYELDYNSDPSPGVNNAEHDFSTEIEWTF